MKWQPRQKDGRSGLVGRLDGSWAARIASANAVGRIPKIFL
jgi:hypothetical protein